MKSQLSFKNVLAFIFALFFIFIPLIVSGDARWMQAWIYCLIVLFFSILSRVLAVRKSPDLVKERASFLAAKGIKDWDKKILPFIAYYVPITASVVFGLDHRFGWSFLPADFWRGFMNGLGLVLFIAGYVLSTWAMVENRFFSSVVRIQKDRGHVVCESGPYRWVRHPGYLGGLISWLGIPLWLDSLWGFIPVFIVIILYLVRTRLEDQTLQAELPGYKEYAVKVPYRIMPGIW